jgi:CBS domain-containing protein
MKTITYKAWLGIALVLSTPAVLAATIEDELATVIKLSGYAFLAFVVVVIVAVYFMRSRDNRRAPLGKVFARTDPIHSVGPDALVTQCVRLMSAKKIGALVIMDGQQLLGIFTERDALTKVLAADLDPRSTSVSDVMTREPYCVPPTMTVAEAMGLVTQRHFRHLPVVENGKVLAVVSSGDLTHWLVKDQMEQVQELVQLAAH